MKKIRNFLFFILAAFCSAVLFVPNFSASAATQSFTLSPMNQTITLTPGETYYGSFKVSNPGANGSNFDYRLEVYPFWVNEEYEALYSPHGNFNLITSWIKLSGTVGSVAPGKSDTVNFEITPPASAPAGGQYLVIKVTSRDGSVTEGANGIRGAYSLGHIIYAEVTGDGLKKSGTVKDGKLSSFVVSSFRPKATETNTSGTVSKSVAKKGTINATATLENTGNTLGIASFILEAYPLFSTEAKYSNASSPATYKILPETSRKVTLAWEDNAPKLGIFKVLYHVSLNGEELKTFDKFVIVVPLWLIILFILIIVGAIALIFVLKKKKGNNNVQTQPHSIVAE